MAAPSDSAVDIGQLSAEQQAALEQYTAVTAQDFAEAVPLLQRSQWNVQIAIAKFFDGEGPDPLAEAIAAQDHIPTQAPRHENLQDSFAEAPFGTVRPGPRRNVPDPAPRIVPQQASTYRPPLLLAMFLAPFSLAHRAVTGAFRTILYLLAFLPASVRPRAITTSITQGFKGTSGRRMLLPRDTAARFKREFEEEYGTSALSFYEGGFAQALDDAKKELKFLLMILVSPEHDDTESFTRETLLSPDVTAFINDPQNNIILWGGNVLDSEAYQVATEYNATKFPFTCVICLTPREGSTRMSIVKRLVGPVAPQTYVAELQAAMTKYAPDLAGVRAERTAQQFTRDLRNEQDSAYERSLATDRERARQRKEAEAAAALAEKTAQEEAEAAERLARLREEWRRWRATTISPEPDSTVGAKDVVRLALKMPESSGAGRIVRRFAAATTIEELYAFVECFEYLDAAVDEKSSLGGGGDVEKPSEYDHVYKFKIASLMPRIVYEPDVDGSATLGDKIGRSGNLIVEAFAEDEEEDEESDNDDEDEE
ncbi:FAS-associated factor 2 [Microdochium nivale]|nr:FAS-associated factor 2 [Microdochium nivale]